MQRVAIVGSGGAGKTTFAQDLGELTGLPVVHLDRHFWKPGWVETPRDEWRVQQTELLAGDRWIADGNYGGTLDVRLSRADTVIVLALPRRRCVQRAFGRSWSNRGEAIQADGCPERIDLAFLKWIWRYPKDSRPRLDAAIAVQLANAADSGSAPLEVVELTSPAQVRGYLERHAPPQPERASRKRRDHRR